jgi:hypothetical protein
MATDRYVVLGLARARAAWFAQVARWATAAAVLIMAFLGALMWVGFKSMWDTTEQKTNDQIEQIGG